MNGRPSVGQIPSREQFPSDFLFGVAGSSYQIEGHGFGGAGPTHWDTFAATPGNVAGRQNGRVACDHYHRYEEDLDLAASACFDAWRFSTSWARILPEGAGTPNAAGLDFYDRLVDGILERGMKPFLTLYHWELPAPLADIGGWANREVAARFADFALVAMGRLGDRIYATAPINEPWCVSWLSHFEGKHAPGISDIRAAARAMHHVLLAHGKAIEAMRSLGATNLGVVANLEFAQPADDRAESARMAKLYDGIFNRWFLDGIFNRCYPDRVLEGLLPHMPKDWELDFDTIGNPLDWIGINYYTRKLIAPDGGGGFPGFKEVEGPLEKSDVGWEVYPEGLAYFLTEIDREYAKGRPVFITENGMASADSITAGTVDDLARIEYIAKHIETARRAAEAGVNLKGYFVWSMLDNFEWTLGYDKRFGIVHVDFDSLKRTPKASYRALKDALVRRAPPDGA